MDAEAEAQRDEVIRWTSASSKPPGQVKGSDSSDFAPVTKLRHREGF